VAFVSLVVLAMASLRATSGNCRGWRRGYVVSAVIALYLNVFVLIAQLFMKVPALKQWRRRGPSRLFLVAQLVCMALFVGVGNWRGNQVPK